MFVIFYEAHPLVANSTCKPCLFLFPINSDTVTIYIDVIFRITDFPDKIISYFCSSRLIWLKIITIGSDRFAFLEIFRS